MPGFEIKKASSGRLYFAPMELFLIYNLWDCYKYYASMELLLKMLWNNNLSILFS